MSMSEGEYQAIDHEFGAPEHTEDADCAVGPDGLCIVCHVHHGDPCPECGARAFHKALCSRFGGE